MKTMKKVFAVFLCFVFVLSFAACGKESAGSNATSTQLTETEMEASLTELARRLENQMRATDPYAKVEFRVEDDGTCAFWVAGTDDNGEVQEMSKLDAGDAGKDVKTMFNTYMSAGFLNAQGEVTGFPDEIPEDQLAKEDDAPDQNTAQSIIENNPLSGEDTQIAGFPGEGSIEVTPSSDSANEFADSSSVPASSSEAADDTQG